MAAPDGTTTTYHFGADGNPTNDTDPVGGTFSATVITAALNDLIYKPTISGTTKTLRGVGYRKNTAAGTWEDPKIVNETGGKKSSAGGTFRITSSSGSDTGKAWVCFEVAGDFVAESITMVGTSYAYASLPIDADSHWAVVSEAGNPVGDWTIEIDSAIVGKINPDNYCSSTLYEVAVATAIDGTVACADRLTDPTGCGAFGPAYSIPGDDQGIACPANLGANQVIGYCVRMTLPANFKRPYGGQLRARIGLQGNPVP